MPLNSIISDYDCQVLLQATNLPTFCATPTPTQSPPSNTPAISQPPSVSTSTLTFRYCKAQNTTCNKSSDCCSNICNEGTCSNAIPLPPQQNKRDICTAGPPGAPPIDQPDGKVDGSDVSCLIAQPYPVATNPGDNPYQASRDLKRDLCSPGSYGQTVGEPDQKINGADWGCMIANPFPYP